MTRWYDYIAAWLAAEIMLTAFVTIPIIGAILAYIVYEFGWLQWYCQYRRRQEFGR